MSSAPNPPLEPVRFSARSTRVLTAVTDTLAPSAPVVVDRNTRVIAFVASYLAYLPALTRLALPLGLWLFEWGPLVFFFAPRPFSRLAPEARLRYVVSWQRSRSPLRRKLMKGLKVLVLMGYFDLPEVRAYIGYQPESFVAERVATRRKRQEAASEPFTTEPSAVLQGRDVRGKLALECDVVVVGSGAGGSAAAYELSARGLDVLVLEEGGYWRTEDFSLDGPAMTKALYRDAGSNLMVGRPDIMFSEGRAVGGSTLVNGGMCWRTPDAVLERWVAELGLPAEQYAPASLAPTFAGVERMLHVAEQSPESIGEDSERLRRGCEALGWRIVPARRNQRDCVGTSSCIYGCPSGAKQSTLVSYLPRAVANGARIHADARVRRVLVDRQGKATGVEGLVHDPVSRRDWPLRVRARAVVVAGGAVQTPVLLQASGLGNRWVGRNLLVHPNVKVLGVYADRVDGWKGVIQGYQVHEFLREGLLMSTSFVPPSLIGPTLPPVGDELMAVMRRFNHMVTAGVLVEDSGSGTVRRGPGGQALIRYQLADDDLARLVRGVGLLSELFFASGATEVHLPLERLPVLHSRDELGSIATHVFDPTELEVLTVHAMGTARMASRAELGATSPDGELWGHPGVFVADASLVPTPIGLNPQITIMALATGVATAIAARLSR